jgi:hypothetical protein
MLLAKKSPRILLLLVLLFCPLPDKMFAANHVEPGQTAEDQPALILFVAGPSSHGEGAHEFYDGGKILAQALEQSGWPVQMEVRAGWPDKPNALDGVAAVVLFSDGLEQHVAAGRSEELAAFMARGGGLAVLHFALEPSDELMGAVFDEVLGGYFKPGISVNPIWTLKEGTVSDHAVGRGVSLQEVEDEWYFHIPLAATAVPVLQALPPLSALGADGPRSGNPEVRAALEAGERQTLAWVHTSPAGARGFGFTGGHFHRNWMDEGFRTLVLNGMVWTAGVEPPAGGVPSEPMVIPVHATIDEAIARGDLEDVRRHLQANPGSLESGSRPGLPPLHQAILRQKEPIAVALMEAGADINSTDGNDRTPLHLAVDRDLPGIAAVLLQKGAQFDRLDSVGWTALHHAASRDRVEIARMIIEAGFDPGTLSRGGGTALHEAAASGSKEMVALLLSAGFDPAIRSKTDVTAMDIAKERNNQAAIELLRKAGPPEP